MCCTAKSSSKGKGRGKCKARTTMFDPLRVVQLLPRHSEPLLEEQVEGLMTKNVRSLAESGRQVNTSTAARKGKTHSKATNIGKRNKSDKG